MVNWHWWSTAVTGPTHLCHWRHLLSQSSLTYATGGISPHSPAAPMPLPQSSPQAWALVASQAGISSYAAGLFVKSETYDLGSGI